MDKQTPVERRDYLRKLAEAEERHLAANPPISDHPYDKAMARMHANQAAHAELHPPTPSPYPENNKLARLAWQRTTITEFLDLCADQGIHLLQWAGDNGKAVHPSTSTQDLVYAYLEIDPDKLEQERRAMLADLQGQQAPAQDPHRLRDEPHWRLYLGRDGKACVICVQSFDYLDYDEARFLSPEAFDSEAAAEAGLAALRAKVQLVGEALS